MIALKAYAAKTDQGPNFEVNEDTYDIDINNNLFMVFDGFGGAAIGDRAVQNLKEKIKHFYLRVSGSPDSTMPFYFSYKYLIEGNALINACYYAHRGLFKDNQKNQLSMRGGASAALVSVADNMATIFLVGNCWVLLYRRGKLIKVLEEDSYRLVGRDDFDRYYRTMPLSAFGLFEDLHFYVKELRLQKDDIIVVLTDGVYSRIQMEEIEYIIGKGHDSLVSKVDTLFNLSNERGNSDNQTGMILYFGDME